MMILGVISDQRAFKSLSPAMHNRILAQTGLAGVYLPLAVAPKDIRAAVEGLRALNLAGANVTVPFKEAVLPLMDQLTETATQVGAVNTIINSGGRLIGHNTDSPGFVNALAASGLDFSGGSALVLGSGGAARGILHALNSAGLGRIRLLARNARAAARLAEPYDALSGGLDQLSSEPLTEKLIINCTSVSSPSEAPDLARLIQGLDLESARLIFDINYSRKENFWQGLARRSKAGFLDGLPLLAHQAALSFACWTGVEVDPGRFLAVLEEGEWT